MKYRYSFQRELVFKELNKANKHLTAEEIYKKVKRKSAKISFGTVYRNLSILEDEGKIKKLNVSSARAVYEAEERPHHHLICKRCGDITNVYEPENLKCMGCFNWIKDFSVEEAYVNAYGICNKCKKKSTTN